LGYECVDRCPVSEANGAFPPGKVGDKAQVPTDGERATLAWPIEFIGDPPGAPAFVADGELVRAAIFALHENAVRIGWAVATAAGGTAGDRIRRMLNLAGTRSTFGGSSVWEPEWPNVWNLRVTLAYTRNDAKAGDETSHNELAYNDACPGSFTTAAYGRSDTEVVAIFLCTDTCWWEVVRRLWMTGKDESRACAVIDVAAVLVHELVHLVLDEESSTHSRSGCDKSYMAENRTRWVLGYRYRGAAASSCCNSWFEGGKGTNKTIRLPKDDLWCCDRFASTDLNCRGGADCKMPELDPATVCQALVP